MDLLLAKLTHATVCMWILALSYTPDLTLSLTIMGRIQVGFSVCLSVCLCQSIWDSTLSRNSFVLYKTRRR